MKISLTTKHLYLYRSIIITVIIVLLLSVIIPITNAIVTEDVILVFMIMEDKILTAFENLMVDFSFWGATFTTAIIWPMEQIFFTGKRVFSTTDPIRVDFEQNEEAWEKTDRLFLDNQIKQRVRKFDINVKKLEIEEMLALQHN